jgi:hypothetical protein
MTKFYYHTWTLADDSKLTEIMTTSERKKVHELFKEAAEKLQRTAKSCQNRWYEIRQEQKAV